MAEAPVPLFSREVERLPDVRSAALALVAIDASPVMVDAACVPVWFALANNIASELLTVAPEAMPANFVKSAEDILPATDPLAGGIDAPPPVELIVDPTIVIFVPAISVD